MEKNLVAHLKRTPQAKLTKQWSSAKLFALALAILTLSRPAFPAVFSTSPAKNICRLIFKKDQVPKQNATPQNQAPAPRAPNFDLARAIVEASRLKTQANSFHQLTYDINSPFNGHQLLTAIDLLEIELKSGKRSYRATRHISMNPQDLVILNRFCRIWCRRFK